MGGRVGGDICKFLRLAGTDTFSMFQIIAE